jgi:hypothetical protein
VDKKLKIIRVTMEMENIRKDEIREMAFRVLFDFVLL